MKTVWKSIRCDPASDPFLSHVMQRVSRSEMCGVVPHDHRDEAQLWTHLGRSPCWPCWPCLPPVPAFYHTNPLDLQGTGEVTTRLSKGGWWTFISPSLVMASQLKKQLLRSWSSVQPFPHVPHAWVMYLLGSLVVVGKPTWEDMKTRTSGNPPSEQLDGRDHPSENPPVSLNQIPPRLLVSTHLGPWVYNHVVMENVTITIVRRKKRWSMRYVPARQV